jgi:ATP-dependent exoDNAse (exonuclease V) beta subunit
MDILKKNLLVLASAGSGKTYCLSDRVIGLLAKDVEPEKIVALTFTRKAAGEFADAILKKLAVASADEQAGRDLAAKFGNEKVDFLELLEGLVGSLPKLSLGTMDGFFARIVKGFQYELGVTGGRFELLEGEVAIGARDELMESLLDGGLDQAAEEEFVEIFRRATAGVEGAKVLDDLREFVGNWHRILVSPEELEWGPPELAGVDLSEWEKQKAGLIEKVKRDLPNVVTTDKRQQKALESMADLLANHTIGSGSLGGKSGLWPKVIDAVSEGSGSAIELSLYKPFSLTGMAAEALRDLVELAARCEFAAALSRTRGIRGMMASYDSLIERELRSRGRLGFDDVKRLMGAWIKSEDARLRREAVDFRLDANYKHWLLDEFQDTSRDEWIGLLPLVDEALTDDEATAFVVGDKKQAIYAWRGGEVGLFDELIETYGSGDDSLKLHTATMAKSWRSCPQVLGLVNQICGDAETISGLFGEAASKSWTEEWEDHVSAEPMAAPDYAGHARVELVEKDEKAGAVVARLKQLGVGQKALSCGVLVSKNDQVREWADLLRGEGFQVVEEGAREPGKDHPVGVMIWQLLRWMADPSDQFAKQVVFMSPLGELFQTRHGGSWERAWEALGEQVGEAGFAGMLRELLAPMESGWGAFGKRRAEDLLQALERLDQTGVVLAREAADWIGRMKISQSPGVAAIQVMTVHKSKGLGFDVVVLPELSGDKIPSFTHFKSVTGNGWVSDAPASWVRQVIPELREAERKWSEQQIYEAFCKLYVALTRAKRGLYVFLDEPPKSAEPDRPSLTNWIFGSLEFETEAGEVFEVGSEDWSMKVPERECDPAASTAALGKAVPKRGRTTPSSGKSAVTWESQGDGFGRLLGLKVHTAFEKVGWLDEDASPEFPAEIAGLMEKALKSPDVRNLLSRDGKKIELYREQRIEAVVGGKWMSGVIDRLHVRRDENGEAHLVEIIDFKTDQVASAEELLTRYAKQMEAYQAAVSRIYPQAEIRCLLVSTALGKVV